MFLLDNVFFCQRNQCLYSIIQWAHGANNQHIQKTAYKNKRIAISTNLWMSCFEQDIQSDCEQQAGN